MPSEKAPMRIPASKGKKAWPLLSIFPGDHGEGWHNYGGNKDNFRLQIGDKFYSRPNERRSFLTPAELGQVLANRIAEAFGVEAGTVSDGSVRINLYLPQGAKVWHYSGSLPEAEMIGAPPRLNDEGEWVVTLAYSGRTVPVTKVKPRTVSMAECLVEPGGCIGGSNEY